MMWFLLALACSSERVDSDVASGAQPVAVPDLSLDLADGPLAVEQYEPFPMTGFTIRPIGFLLRPGFGVSAAWYVPEEPSGAAVIMAHGHFGEGKSGAEAQEIAHRLAASGVRVLAIDTPGVEERARSGRAIHDEAGAHNRGWLLAAGTHAMALQLSVLRRGLDFLEEEGITRVAAVGASGGAVQSFYLGLIDDRVDAVVLASMPRIPREARAGGCPCDQIPGLPGPQPGLLARLSVPSLWLSEVPQEAPDGLPRNARFEVIEGPHGFGPDMQRRALDFLAEELGFSLSDWQEGDLNLVDLRTPGTLGTELDIMELPLQGTRDWRPEPWDSVPYEVECTGSGPVVAIAGGDDADVSAVETAGFRACRVLLPVDQLGHEEAVGTGRVYADRQAGGLLAAVRSSGAQAIWSVGPWSLAASGTGLPYVIRRPILELSDLRPAEDPAWVHVPGAWWGVLRSIGSAAHRSDVEREPLSSALRELLLPSSGVPEASNGSDGTGRRE